MFLLTLGVMMCGTLVDALTPVKSPDFEIGDASFKGKTVIYRLIGNDMPPLQQRGQLRWNTKYALDNEPHFHGVTKRWILNRIWNETDYQGIYSDLLNAGVNRRDIVNNCFDLDKYKSYDTIDDKMFYLTAQNEGRNSGIVDGKESGFEWIVVLDGNTFITKDRYELMHADNNNPLPLYSSHPSFMYTSDTITLRQKHCMNLLFNMYLFPLLLLIM